jgi:hypothetical protein
MKHPVSVRVTAGVNLRACKMNSPKIKQVVQQSRRPHQISISVQIPQIKKIKGIVCLSETPCIQTVS